MLSSREQIVEQLRRHGLRATGSRVSVYAAVEGLDGHPDVQGIIARVHAGGETVSTQAVYDHHIVCRTCGATQDIDCAAGGAPCLEPESTGGFAVDEAEVTFWGLCPDCQRRAANENLAEAAK